MGLRVGLDDRTQDSLPDSFNSGDDDDLALVQVNVAGLTATFEAAPQMADRRNRPLNYCRGTGRVVQEPVRPRSSWATSDRLFQHLEATETSGGYISFCDFPWRRPPPGAQPLGSHVHHTIRDGLLRSSCSCHLRKEVVRKYLGRYCCPLHGVSVFGREQIPLYAKSAFKCAQSGTSARESGRAFHEASPEHR